MKRKYQAIVTTANENTKEVRSKLMTLSEEEFLDLPATKEKYDKWLPPYMFTAKIEPIIQM